MNEADLMIKIQDVGHAIWDGLLGRMLLLLVGGIVIAVTVTVYLSLRGVVLWSFPLGLIIWGGSRVYLFRRNERLSLIAGCLLILGGITRAVFQLIPLNELAGTVANLIPVVGIFAEMFAHHYREREWIGPTVAAAQRFSFGKSTRSCQGQRYHRTR